MREPTVGMVATDPNVGPPSVGPTAADPPSAIGPSFPAVSTADHVPVAMETGLLHAVAPAAEPHSIDGTRAEHPPFSHPHPPSAAALLSGFAAPHPAAAASRIEATAAWCTAVALRDRAAGLRGPRWVRVAGLAGEVAAELDRLAAGVFEEAAVEFEAVAAACDVGAEWRREAGVAREEAGAARRRIEGDVDAKKPDGVAGTVCQALKAEACVRDAATQTMDVGLDSAGKTGTWTCTCGATAVNVSPHTAELAEKRPATDTVPATKESIEGRGGAVTISEEAATLTNGPVRFGVGAPRSCAMWIRDGSGKWKKVNVTAGTDDVVTLMRGGKVDGGTANAGVDVGAAAAATASKAAVARESDAARVSMNAKGEAAVVADKQRSAEKKDVGWAGDAVAATKTVVVSAATALGKGKTDTAAAVRNDAVTQLRKTTKAARKGSLQPTTVAFGTAFRIAGGSRVEKKVPAALLEMTDFQLQKNKLPGVDVEAAIMVAKEDRGKGEALTLENRANVLTLTKNTKKKDCPETQLKTATSGQTKKHSPSPGVADSANPSGRRMRECCIRTLAAANIQDTDPRLAKSCGVKHVAKGVRVETVSADAMAVAKKSNPAKKVALVCDGRVTVPENVKTALEAAAPLPAMLAPVAPAADKPQVRTESPAVHVADAAVKESEEFTEAKISADAAHALAVAACECAAEAQSRAAAAKKRAFDAFEKVLTLTKDVLAARSSSWAELLWRAVAKHADDSAALEENAALLYDVVAMWEIKSVNRHKYAAAFGEVAAKGAPDARDAAAFRKKAASHGVEVAVSSRKAKAALAEVSEARERASVVQATAVAARAKALAASSLGEVKASLRG
ncbi:hypothetical protein HDU96_004226 [Phlyctochytrium bullatum]|nr:hypothetical protein HDU96_004226 [Phlyctochytrium bullatum]